MTHFDRRISTCVLSVAIGCLAGGCLPGSDSADKQEPSTPLSDHAGSKPSGAVANATDSVEEGGSYARIDARREEIHLYFDRLKESGDANEERKAIQALAAWTNDPQHGENGYLIRVVKENVWLSKHDLDDLATQGQTVTVRIECPYFPPVTPWVSYRFNDPSNLKYLLGVLWEPASDAPASNEALSLEW